MIERHFDLFLNAGKALPLLINVNQFDHGEKWIFTLYNDDGTQYIPSTGAIVGVKSDGYGIINSGSIEDGNVVIMETEQMTAAVGKATFELMIDSQTHGTANFNVLVEAKPGNNATYSDSDVSLIQEAVDATSPLPTGGTVGQVLTKTAQGSTWSDAGTPTQEQVAEAVSDWADENITVETGVVIDTSLSVAGAAADAKVTGDEISELKSAIAQLEAIPYSVKTAMDTLFSKIAVKDDDGYSDEYATIHNWVTSVSVTAITASFTQGSNVIYDDDSLDELKQYLTVTAYYSNGTNSAVSSYTLSGTLTAGTSTITATYSGKSASFSVSVTASGLIYSLLDHVFDGTSSSAVDTDLLLNQTDTDFTVLFELDTTASQSSASSIPAYRIINTIDAATSGGLSLVKYDRTRTNFRWCTQAVQFTDFTETSIGNFKFAITHTAGSGSASLKVRANNGTINTYTASASFNASSVALQLGTNGDHTNTLKGTGSCKVYDEVLSSDRITDFMNNGI